MPHVSTECEKNNENLYLNKIYYCLFCSQLNKLLILCTTNKIHLNDTSLYYVTKLCMSCISMKAVIVTSLSRRICDMF